MRPTRRMLRGIIAGNPGNYAGLGEWRYCHDCQEAFFARASRPDPGHSAHRWSALPALDPEGQAHLAELFRAFIREAYPPARQSQLEAFAKRCGWDMAYELQDGGGALSAPEVVPWRKVVDAELERLTDEAECIVGDL